MAINKRQIIAMSAAVSIQAASAGESDGPAKFTSTFYTGGAMNINGWDLPVVIDLAGLTPGNVLVANLDHDATKRVGNFAVANDGKSLVANGTATAATAARDEVVNSAAAGYQWQASLEVTPHQVDEVKSGKQVEVNGQQFTGPLYVTRRGTLKGFAFVSHGADDNTKASIAASSATNKERIMKPEVKAWAEKVYAGVVDVDNLTAEQVATIEANYAGLPKPKKASSLGDGILAHQAEADRIEAITEHALTMCDRMKFDFNAKDRMNAINELAQQAIDAKWGFDKYRLEVIESGIPLSTTVPPARGRDKALNSKVVEAAICQAGRLDGHEKMFDDQTLQAAHDRFKGRIGLKQLFLLAAQSNGYHEHNLEVTLEVQRAAFGMQGPQRQIHAQGWSTIEISSILSNTANKFIMRGWNMVDRTCLEIAKIQNVRDFKTATTVSLTDSVLYEKVGAAGEIKHGTLGELSYTVKADTYAKMLAITRQDIINDDLGALTDVPMKLGNGAIKILNSIFWTEFLGLVGASFFASGNSNINTGAADMTDAGLDATNVIFKNQTNPDGTPLGVEPRIVLVPTALEGKARRLMGSEYTNNGASVNNGAANIWKDRFRVLTSPYISNSSYSGYTSTGWWMLADPNELPVIAIAALNGKVEPTVETADADFNVLGVQMRGYSDVGVNDQEYRGGVYADGGAS